MSESPYHAAAKWLVEILKPVHKVITKHYLRDSIEFVKRAKDITVKDQHMLSLDASALFTNVPLVETINYVCDYIYIYIYIYRLDVGIPTDRLKELITPCTMNIQFQFNNELYKQIDGVAMGSPLGPLLADVFMAKLEKNLLNDQITQFDVYLRYIDDIFIVCDKCLQSEDIVVLFNSAHNGISFTHEIEENDQFPFLDVLLIGRNDGSLQRTVYRKPTWVGQYTHFNSFVPLRYKRNLVRCLSSRARNICTDDTLNEELQFIGSTLRENGYPDQFISKNIKHKSNEPITIQVEKKRLHIKLDFKGDINHEILSKKLNKIIRQTFPAASLQLQFRTHPIIPQNSKDKLPSSTTSMCIYKFNCSCGSSYIGRTTRQLSKRIKEHNPAWLRKGLTKSIQSSIVQHLVDTGHQINTDDAFSICYRVPLRSTKSARTRLLHIAEAVAIKIFRPELCIQKKFVQTLLLPWPKIFYLFNIFLQLAFISYSTSVILLTNLCYPYYIFGISNWTLSLLSPSFTICVNRFDPITCSLS